MHPGGSLGLGCTFSNSISHCRLLCWSNFQTHRSIGSERLSKPRYTTSGVLWYPWYPSLRCAKRLLSLGSGRRQCSWLDPEKLQAHTTSCWSLLLLSETNQKPHGLLLLCLSIWSTETRRVTSGDTLIPSSLYKLRCFLSQASSSR